MVNETRVVGMGHDADTDGLAVNQETEGYCVVFHETIELLGRRWNGVILQALLGGVERFGEIRDLVPGISDRLLTQRLRELECEGLLARTCDAESSASPRYRLTEKGRALSPVLDAVSSWAMNWGSRGGHPEAAGAPSPVRD